MDTKTTGKNRINTFLSLFIIINIIGDIGNVAFWWANPDSRAASLNTSYLATVAGVDNALIAGTAILLIVAFIYAIGLFGLLKKQKWAPLLVIVISIANRTLALVIYFISPAFAFWAIWTIILVALAYMDYRKLSTAPATAQAPPPSAPIQS
jgi:hypothetical protein